MSSPNPPTLLLRIVATAGAGALLGATACGASAAGSVALPPADAEAEAQGPCGGGPCGSVAMPLPDAGEAGTVGLVANPDSGGVMPFDAGEAAVVGGGIMVSQDSGSDARGPCNGGPCGVVIHPEAGFDQ